MAKNLAFLKFYAYKKFEVQFRKMYALVKVIDSLVTFFDCTFNCLLILCIHFGRDRSWILEFDPFLVGNNRLQLENWSWKQCVNWCRRFLSNFKVFNGFFPIENKFFQLKTFRLRDLSNYKYAPFYYEWVYFTVMCAGSHWNVNLCGPNLLK